MKYIFFNKKYIMIEMAKSISYSIERARERENKSEREWKNSKIKSKKLYLRSIC